ncbi:hypothetical protein Ctob_009207 [Chrysochromulina tobinii]|uniref:Uncharacterized protein n=1 Tax=Chrysochromulina tobinii TaxID=1460289 RepID=A0A0M0K083_9EUKA|nr:hypothetical protein Ctob_009207 [Chrysochromulina tobinii]|eukprot:KOO31977.1 hypothetical protein Ctob_009207 [Chrysochromulina sp. CCMP291]
MAIPPPTNPALRQLDAYEIWRAPIQCQTRCGTIYSRPVILDAGDARRIFRSFSCDDDEFSDADLSYYSVD